MGTVEELDTARGTEGGEAGKATALVDSYMSVRFIFSIWWLNL